MSSRTRLLATVGILLVLLACGPLPGPVAPETPAEPPTSTGVPPSPVPPTEVAPPEAVPTSTSSPASVPDGWLCYSNEWADPFTVCYPPDATLTESPPDAARVDLSIVPGTNLSEKWLEVAVFPSMTTCSGPYGPGPGPLEAVTINGLEFTRDTGGDAGAGNYYTWESYSTTRGDTCVALTFVLHSTNPLAWATPIPEFDQAAEAEVFQRILATFFWWD
jgi:hypothetical protein